MQITLAQFEKIDGALQTFFAHEHGRYAAVSESRLFDALIDLLGYPKANEIPSVSEYASQLVTGCLTGKIAVLDGEVA